MNDVTRKRLLTPSGNGTWTEKPYNRFGDAFEKPSPSLLKACEGAMMPVDTLAEWGSPEAYDALHTKEIQFIQLMSVLSTRTPETGNYVISDKAAPFFGNRPELYLRRAELLPTETIRRNAIVTLADEYIALNKVQAKKIAQLGQKIGPAL